MDNKTCPTCKSIFKYPSRLKIHLQNTIHCKKTNAEIDTYFSNIKNQSSTEQISLQGYCTGATIATAYTALHPENVKNYVATGSSYQAKLGQTDDLISATLLALRMMAVLKDWDPRVYDSFNQADDYDDYDMPMPIFISSNY